MSLFSIQSQTGQPNRLAAYDHNGTFKWFSPFYNVHPDGTSLTNRDNPSIADLDRDGVPEIIVGATVFDNLGNLKWVGTGGQGYQSARNEEDIDSGAISIAADLDLEGGLELVTGNTAYSADGSIFWQIAEDDGYPAVANFDADPFPEIVVVSRGNLRLHEPDGTLIWGPIALPGTGDEAGGAPTVANFDADPEPEIGVAGSTQYTVFEADGTIKWQSAIQDGSSNMTGSTVFDLDGDGQFEVIYRDEAYLRIYRGDDGVVLYELALSSFTANEEVVVADVDGDGNAEIVVPSNRAPGVSGLPAVTAGIFVIGDSADQWISARGVWNQHQYHIDNINDDGTIPADEQPGWLTHNSYRANSAAEAGAFAAPDVSASGITVDLSAFPMVGLTARIGNGGTTAVAPGLSVAFYEGDPGAGGVLIEAVELAGELAPGAFVDVSIAQVLPGFGSFALYVVADDDGTGQGRESECDENNNVHSLAYGTDDLGLFLGLVDGVEQVNAGDLVTYTITVTNANSFDRTGVLITDTLPTDVIVDSISDGGTEAGGVITWSVFTLAGGAVAVRSVALQVDPAIPLGVATLTNVASVTDDGAGGPDPTPDNNSATDVNGVLTVRALAGGPYAGNEGTPIDFDGSASSDRDGTVVAWDWDFDGDGTTDASGVNAQHTFTDDGVFTVTLTATDDSGESDTDSAEVTVGNLVPAVAAGADQAAAEGDAVTLAAATFTDPGADDTHTATVDWGDGSAVEPAIVDQLAGTVSAGHDYLDDGNFTIEVCVTDDDGGTGCDQLAVAVDNAAPLVVEGTDIDLNEWQQEDLDSPGSWSVAGDGLSVNQSANADPTVFYGPFTAIGVGLDASIQVGNNGDDDFIGFVIGFKPGDFSNPNAEYLVLDWKQANQDSALRGLALSRVFGQPTSGELWAHWDDPANGSENRVDELQRGFTRGSSGWPENTPIVFTFETSPTNIRVLVDGVLEIDLAGDFNFGGGRFGFYNLSQGSTTYFLNEVAGVSVLEGEPASVAVPFSDVGVLDTHTATIDWQDGTVEAGTVVEDNGSGTVEGVHVYPEQGDFEIEVCVTDDEGLSDCGLFPVTVLNAVAAVDAGGDRNAFAGEGLDLTADFVDTGTLDTHTATIDWGDGTVEAGTVAELDGAGTVSGLHSYAAVGTYTVEVCVTDDDGATGCDAFELLWFDEAAIYDAAIAKSASLGTVRPGEPLIYTLTVTNLGTRTPQNLTVTDVLPADLEFVSASDGGSFDAPSRTVSWTLPLLPYQSSVVLTVIVRAADPLPFGATAVNSASVPTAGPFGVDVNPGDNTASASVVLWDAETPRVDLGDSRTEVEGVTVELDTIFDDALVVTGSATIPTSGLVAHWSFDQRTDPAVDTVNSLLAQLGTTAGEDINDPTYYCATEVAPLGGNTCGLNLVGRDEPTTDDSVSIANDPLLDFTDAYTLSAWVRLDSTSDHRPFFVRGANDSVTNANDIEVYSQSGSRDLIVFHNRDNGGDSHLVGFDNPPSNSYFHLAVTFDGAEVHAYYNGVEPAIVNSDEFLAPPLATGKDWLLGKVNHSIFDSGSDREKFLDGRMDDVRFYDRALSAAEVMELATVTGVSQTHTASVDWGDGTVEAASIGTGGNVTGSHLYPDDFSTTLELCVTDDTGLTGCDSVPIEIENFVPEVLEEVVSGVEGDTLPLDVGFNDTGTLDTHTATIDWSDGTVEPGVVTFAGTTGTVSGSHFFAESAVYDTEVCVTDDDLGTGCRIFSAQIRNAAATVDAGPDLVVNVGQAFTLNATFVDPGILDTHTAPFFWGDGSFDQATVAETDGAGTASASHAYTQPGIRVISACVDDDEGARACDLVQVDVIGVALPDLVVPTVNSTGVSVDPQTLLTTGTVVATVANGGDAPTVGDFVVTFFDDADGDGLFGAGDPVLGTEIVSGSMSVDEERLVSTTVDYTAVFAGDLIFAFADSGGVEAESSEVNNINQSGVVCEFEPPTGTFAPALEWSWTTSDVFASWSHVIVTPLVGDITGDGVPDIVFSSRADLSGNCDAPGIVRAISGDGGAAIFDITDDTLRVDSCTPLAMGDIDGDNLPEIIAHRKTPNGIMAFEHTGELKWSWEGTGGASAIANIDSDGLPEIVVGSKVLNADGTLLWDAGLAVSSVASVADLDLDGTPELVYGSRALNNDGTDFYTNTAGLPEVTFSAVANFDADLEPEIVAVGSGSIWLLENDGSVVWTITPTGLVSGGPPTIADYDGDGQPEVGVAGSNRYVVLDTDGTLLWEANTIDTSSRVTGSSVFDFEADGRSEVIYNDHNNLRVYDGLDGTVLFQTSNSSCTSIEYPVVADVDADGNAEIIVARNRMCGLGSTSNGQGIFVFGAGDSWVATREVWNQHAYHVTNVNSDLTIPVEELPSWLDPGPNSYRAQVLPAGNPLAAPDLTLSNIRVDTAACPAQVSLVARLGNAGGNVAPAPVEVTFYQGDPAAGVVLGTTQTTVSLEPGEFEDVVLILPPVGGGGTQVCVVADEAGAVGECNEDNTLCVDLIPGCSSADLAVSKTDGLDTAFAGQPIQYTVTVDNLGPDDVPVASVSDLLPTELLGVTWTCTGAGGASCTAGPVAGDVLDTATLPAGSSAIYAITGTVDAAFSGTLTNTASVASTVVELDPTNDSATDVTVVVLTPELSASKDDSLAADNDADGEPSPGDEIGYTVVISNGGGSATGVVLTDLITADTSMVAGSVATDRGTVDSEDPVQVSVGALGFGETATITFRLLVDNPVPAGVMDIVNQGVVTSNEVPAVLTDDPALGGDSDPTETMIATEPMLVAEKSDELVVDADGDGVPSPGDTLEYTSTLINNGNTSSTSVAFNDAIPENTAVVPGSVTTSQGSVDSEDPVTVTVGEIAGGGASVEIAFRVTIDNPVPAGVMDVTNQGEAASAEQPPILTDDPDVGGDADPTVTMVAAEPELLVEKTDVLFADGDDNGVATPGDVLLYQITLDNTGNTSATAVVLSDSVPTDTTLEPGSVQTSQGTVVTEDPVEIDLGELAAGATATVSFRVTIDDPFPFDSLEVANQASVASNELAAVLSDDPDSGPTGDPTATPVFIFPELAVIGTSATEADAAASGLVFTVTLSEPSNRFLGVEYETEDQTALAGLDYVAQSGEVSFQPGEVSAPVTVFGLDDPLDEIDETMALNLVSLLGSTLAQGIGTILDDDAPPLLSVGDASVTEGDSGATQALFTLSLTAPAALDVTLDFATADGTASAGLDYTAAAGSITIPAGEVSGTIVVDVLGDTDDESDETFFVDLSNVAGAIPADTQGLGTILDDDEAPPELTASKVDSLFADNDGDLVPSPGDELRYDVVVSNVGGSPAAGVVFDDLIPAHTAVVSGSVTSDVGTILSENPVQVDLGSLAGGQAATLSFRVLIDDSVPAGVMDVVNQGVVTSVELPAVLTDDPALGGGADPTETMIAAAPQLVVEKSDALVVDADGDLTPSPGDTLEYTVTLVNVGNTSATAVAFDDAIPVDTALVTGSVTTSQGTVDGEDPVAITVGEIPGGGASVAVTFRVTIDNPLPAGVLDVVNQGQATSAELPPVPTDDPDFGGDSDPTVTMVTAAPELIVEKADVLFADADGDGVASPGDTLLYMLTIDNIGNTSATAVVLSDPIPLDAEVEAGSVQTSQGSVLGESPVEIDLGEIVGGADATVSFRVTIDDPFPSGATELSNQATVTSAELAAVPSNDPDTPADGDATLTEIFITPEISIGDASATEADAAATGLSFAVTLAESPNRALSVDYATSDQTALAGADYVAAAGTVTFAPGETARTVVVIGLEDTIDEPDETLLVDLSNPGGGTLLDAQAVGTLLDDDAAPGMGTGNVTVVEGDAASVTAVFGVTLAEPSGFDVSVSYATSDGTASAAIDYLAAAGVLTIPAGATSSSISIDVLGDVVDELDETFFLTLTDPVNALLVDDLGIGTILDDDEFQISIGDVSIDEGDSGTSDALFPVSLTTPAPAPVTMDYVSSDDTATSGADYQSVSGPLTIAAGDSETTIAVPVIGDGVLEEDETFLLTLSNASAGILADPVGVATIVDDELCPSPNLLLNAGAEEPLDNGELPNWTEVPAGDWQPRFLDPDPFEGLAYFFAGAADVAELRQDVDVSAYAAFIAAGDLLFRFTGQVRTFDESPEDSARIVIEFRDATNSVVLSSFDSGEISGSLDWSEISAVRPAPVGTGWIRVALIAVRYSGGTDADAYFDDLVLESLKVPVLSTGDALVTEGDSGTTGALFELTLSCPTAADVTVTTTTADGTAVAGDDYQALPPTAQTIPSQSTGVTVTVDVFGDALEEDDEHFFLDLTDPVNAVVLDPDGTGLILDDDGAAFCPRSPGYWKTHTEEWPVQELELGGLLYGAGALEGFLDYGGSDMSMKLARQLTATLLNLASGSDPSILPVVDLADAFLAEHPPGSKPKGSDKAEAEGLKDQLDAYNNTDCGDD